MPVTNFHSLCISITIDATQQCISMPGGVQLCAPALPSLVPGGAGMGLQALFDKLNSAMAPLQPVFNIIEAVIAVFDCIKAIATLNPEKIVKCLPNLAQKIQALLMLIPQLSVPLMIRDFILALIAHLKNELAHLQRLAEYQARILAANLAAADVGVIVDAYINCATADLEAMFAFRGAQSAPINRIIGLINAFLKLLGLPCIPEIGAVTPSTLGPFQLLLAKLIEFLEYLASILTIPIPAPQLALSAEDC